MQAERPLLLDTHVWLWLAFDIPGKISPSTRARLEQASIESPLWISIVSIWEIALLESKGRLRLPMSVDAWVRHAFSLPEIRLLKLDDPQVTIASCNLPGGFHPDPADRFLVASARHLNAELVTQDQKILDYGKAGYVQVLSA